MTLRIASSIAFRMSWLIAVSFGFRVLQAFHPSLNFDTLPFSLSQFIRTVSSNKLTGAQLPPRASVSDVGFEFIYFWCRPRPLPAAVAQFGRYAYWPTPRLQFESLLGRTGLGCFHPRPFRKVPIRATVGCSRIHAPRFGRCCSRLCCSLSFSSPYYFTRPTFRGVWFPALRAAQVLAGVFQNKSVDTKIGITTGCRKQPIRVAVSSVSLMSAVPDPER